MLNYSQKKSLLFHQVENLKIQFKNFNKSFDEIKKTLIDLKNFCNIDKLFEINYTNGISSFYEQFQKTFENMK